MNLRKTLCLVLCLIGGTCLAAKAAGKQTGKLEFRAAETKPAEGLIEAIVPDSEGKKIYLHKQAALTNRHIASARSVADSTGRPSLEIVFTDAGSKAVEKLTQQQLGKPIAILFEGKLIAAPTVRSKISTKALITGNFTNNQINRFLKALRTK